ncbi:MAG: hypothetical protein IKI20_09765 [Lachnospiraceae bacterium]|nr:hypothetical protein [Lachnospiraceae bacterium]
MKKRIIGGLGIVCMAIFLCACDLDNDKQASKANLVETSLIVAETESESISEEESEEVSERFSETVSETEPAGPNTDPSQIKVDTMTEVRYVSKNTKIRLGNSYYFDEISEIKERTKIQITGKCDNGWYQISIDGTVAYIQEKCTISEKEYNKLVEEEKKQAEEKAQKEAEEKAKKEAEEKAKKEAEEKKAAEQNAAITDVATQILAIVNQEREKAGVGALTLDPTLCVLANARASEITTLFAHQRPNGQDCFSILDENGVNYMCCGENIAAGQRSAESVMSAWMNSPGHRDNILAADFHKIGVGLVVIDGGYGYYWVQIFTD